MLVEVVLRCFRQHVSRTFTFTEGLNLLRGRNEGGKTTILEAIRYALGGSRALDESIGDIVTWDHKDTDMSVKVTFSILGVPYTFERSVKGATVTSTALNKPVTGQNEVTNFASELFGGSSKTLNLLLLASQNGLQDVIDAGPGEVSGLVAKLGNLDVIDAVLAQADQDLVSGSDKTYLDRISSLISMEDHVVASGPSPEELQRLESGLEQLLGRAIEARDTLEKVWHPAADVAAAAVEDSQRKADAILRAKGRVDTVKADISTMEASRAQAAGVSKPEENSLEALRREKVTSQDMDRVEALYRSLMELNARRPAETWQAEGEEIAAVEVNREFTRVDGEYRAEQAKNSDDFKASDLARAEADLAAAYKLTNPNAQAASEKRAAAETPFRADDIAQAQALIDETLGSIGVKRRDAGKVVDVGGLKCNACGRDFDNAEQRREHIAREKAEVDVAKAELSVLEANLSTYTAQLAGIRRDVEQYRQRLRDEADALLREGDIENRTKVNAAQSAVSAVRAEIQNYRAQAQARARELNVTREKLLALLSVGIDFSSFGKAHESSGYISVDYMVYPPKIEWTGPEGRGRVRAESEVDRDIQQWESYRLAWERAQGVLETLDRNLVAMREACARAEQELGALPEANLEAATAHHQEVLARTNQAQVASAEATLAMEQGREALVAYQARATSHATELATVRQRLEDARSQLVEIQTNNAFIKEVKKLKPLITEHMWSKALAAISNYFSDLRGQNVNVTREGGLFRFNGRPASSLSGSGKDILAIAIRAALGRVFLPHIGMIVLDEPAHGSDEERTARILGFLSKCGYEQIVLASHDPLSESVADNIIYVQEGN